MYYSFREYPFPPVCRSLRFLILPCLGVLCLTPRPLFPRVPNLSCLAVPKKHVRCLLSRRSRLNHVSAPPPNPDYITTYRDQWLSPRTHINQLPSLSRSSPILSCVQSSRTLFCFRTCSVISDWKYCAHSSTTTIRPWVTFARGFSSLSISLDLTARSPGHEYGSH